MILVPERLARRLMIKPQETRQLVYFSTLFFLIGLGLAIGRGTSYALFFKHYGVESLPAMYMVLAVALLLISSFYAAYSDRISAEKMLRVLILVLLSVLLVSWSLMSAGALSISYPLYFLIFELASELLVVHFALYLNQNFDALQAKRLSPLIFAGLQAGSMTGGGVLLLGAESLGTVNMVLVWLVLLVVCIPVINRFHHRTGVSRYFRHGVARSNRSGELIQQLIQGLRFAGRSELLRMITMASFFMVVSFYVLSYSVNLVYVNSFETTEQLTAFFGALTAVTSFIALFLQVFFTSRIVQNLGVARANLIYPIASVVSFMGLLLSFSFPLALLGSFNREALLSGVRAPVRNLFFNALPNYMQGRARALGLALILPAALAFAGLLLMFAQRSDNPLHFLLLGAFSAVTYLYFAWRMGNAYTKEILLTLKDKVHLPESAGLIKVGEGDTGLLDEILRGIDDTDQKIRCDYVSMLINANPEKALEVLSSRLASFTVDQQDRIVSSLAKYNPKGFDKWLQGIGDGADNHLRSTIYNYFVEQKNEWVIPKVRESLGSMNPRIRAVGIYGVLSFQLEELDASARAKWTSMLNSQLGEENLAALDLLVRYPCGEYQSMLLVLLESKNQRVVCKALEALERCSTIGLSTGLHGSLRRIIENPDPVFRSMAVKCAQSLPYAERMSLIYEAMEDGHPEVRREAAQLLCKDMEHGLDYLESSILEHRFSVRTQCDLLREYIRKQPGKARLEKIAYKKAEDAVEVLQVREYLRQYRNNKVSGEGLELISIVLCERLQLIMEMILLIFSETEDAEAIEIIQCGLKSGDSRHVANAAEALHNIADQRLAGLLDQIIEGLGAKDTEQITDCGEFSGEGQVLRWCEQRNDAWLSECMVWAIGESTIDSSVSVVN